MPANKYVLEEVIDGIKKGTFTKTKIIINNQTLKPKDLEQLFTAITENQKFAQELQELDFSNDPHPPVTGGVYHGSSNLRPRQRHFDNVLITFNIPNLPKLVKLNIAHTFAVCVIFENVPTLTAGIDLPQLEIISENKDLIIRDRAKELYTLHQPEVLEAAPQAPRKNATVTETDPEDEQDIVVDIPLKRSVTRKSYAQAMREAEEKEHTLVKHGEDTSIDVNSDEEEDECLEDELFPTVTLSSPAQCKYSNPPIDVPREDGPVKKTSLFFSVLSSCMPFSSCLSKEKLHIHKLSKDSKGSVSLPPEPEFTITNHLNPSRVNKLKNLG